jgi:hypothetical protein
MAINFRRSSSQIKPPLGARLIQGHPLAANIVGCWLFNEVAGLLANSLVNGNDTLTLAGGNWLNFLGALYDMTAGNGTHGLLTTPSAALQPANAVSLYWRGLRFGGGNLSNNPAIAAMTFTSTAATPFYAYGVLRVNGSNTDLYYWDDAGGTANFQQITVLPNHQTTDIFDLGLTVRNGGNAVAYFNGRQVGSAARSGSLSYGSPRLILNDDFNTENAATAVEALYIWNRELSATEMLWLHVEPYDLLNWKTPKNRRYFGIPAPPPAALVAVPDFQMPQLLAQ